MAAPRRRWMCTYVAACVVAAAVLPAATEWVRLGDTNTRALAQDLRQIAAQPMPFVLLAMPYLILVLLAPTRLRKATLTGGLVAVIGTQLVGAALVLDAADLFAVAAAQLILAIPAGLAIGSLAGWLFRRTLGEPKPR